MDFDINIYVFKGRVYNCYFYAYDLGKISITIGNSPSTCISYGFIGIMAIEADYTFLTRIEFFTESDFVPVYHHDSGAGH